MKLSLNIMAREIHIGDYEIIFRDDDGFSGSGEWWMHGPDGDGFQMSDEIMRDFETCIACFFKGTM